MIKHALVLLLPLLLALLGRSKAVKDAKPEPYDLMDDAMADLEALREIVENEIFLAESVFHEGYLRISRFSNMMLDNARLDIDAEYQSAVEKLNTIKDLAFAANKDISTCTSGREDTLDQLPDEVKGRVTTCKDDKNKEAASIVDDGNYVVDVTVTKVNNFEFQLDLCETGSIVCISPIITQIQLANVQLPQSIEIAVDRFKDLLEKLRPQIQDCLDTNVADFVSDVNVLVEDIATCANGILGK